MYNLFKENFNHSSIVLDSVLFMNLLPFVELLVLTFPRADNSQLSHHIVKLFLSLPLLNQELLPLVIIILLHVGLAVVGLDEDLLDASADTLKLMKLVLLQIFVNLEEDHLEWRLSLYQIQDLEVLLV